MNTTRPFIYKYTPDCFKDFQIDNDIITVAAP